MKKMLMMIVSVFLIGSISGATAGTTDPKKKNNSKDGKGEVTAGAQGVTDYAWGYQLAQYGKENNYPEALLVAAHVLKGVAPATEKRSKTEEGDAVAENGQKTGTLMTPDDMLAAAKRMAEGENAQLVAMIDKEMAVKGTKGAVGGPNLHTDRVRAGETDVYELSFRGGESARILVQGDGDCDLDLYVYDENGNLMDKDIDYDDTCLAIWTPKWTGKFKIKVKNRGSVYADYLLMTN